MYSLEKCNFTMQMDEIEYEEEKTCDGGENVNLSEVDQTYSGPLKSWYCSHLSDFWTMHYTSVRLGSTSSELINGPQADAVHQRPLEE